MYDSLTDRDTKTPAQGTCLTVKHPRVLGAHMLGGHAAEIIQMLAVALKMGALTTDLDATIGIHPAADEEFVTMK